MISAEDSTPRRDTDGLATPLIELASAGRDALVVAQRATAASHYLEAFVSASFALIRAGRWHPWVLDRRLSLALLATGSLRNRAHHAADLVNSSISCIIPMLDESIDVSTGELIDTACAAACRSTRRVQAVEQRWVSLEKHLTPFIEQYGIEDGIEWAQVDTGNLPKVIDQHLENLDASTRLGYTALYVQEQLLNRALDDIKDMTDPGEIIETVRKAYHAIDITGYMPAHSFATTHRRTLQELTWLAEFWDRLPNWKPEEHEEFKQALSNITGYQSRNAEENADTIEWASARLYRYAK